MQRPAVLPVKRKDEKKHIFECQERMIKCNNCNDNYKFTSENELHNSKITCEFCNLEHYTCQILSHDKICPEIIMNCKFISCKEKFKRKDYDLHMEKFNSCHLEQLNDLVIDFSHLMHYFVENASHNVVKMMEKIDGKINHKFDIYKNINDESKPIISDMYKNITIEIETNKKTNKTKKKEKKEENPAQVNYMEEVD
jgi:hypothetical protein